MNDARRGFTLLEVVLATTALALLTAICYGAFHLGIRAIERGEVAVVTTQRLRVASDVMIRQLKSAVPFPSRNEDEEVCPYFLGTATSLAFVTAAGLQGGGGLARVVYQLVESPTRLVISESPFFSPDVLGRGAVEDPGARSAVLLDGFRALRFAYVRWDGVDFEADVPDWNGCDEETMPAAVQIQVEGLPGLEVDLWRQDVPVMALNYSELGGEVDEEDADEVFQGGVPGDEDDEDEAHDG
jgi:prepilin-type N-terminal cleavage/methylation domain-containing protein